MEQDRSKSLLNLKLSEILSSTGISDSFGVAYKETSPACILAEDSFSPKEQDSAAYFHLKKACELALTKQSRALSSENQAFL